MNKKKYSGKLNEEQTEVFNLIQDIIGCNVTVEPLSDSGLELGGYPLWNSHIKTMEDKGLIVFHTKPGKLAVYRKD